MFESSPNMFDGNEVWRLYWLLQSAKWLLEKPFLNNLRLMYKSIIMLKMTLLGVMP